MAGQETVASFAVTETETSRAGLFVVVPEAAGVRAGMTVENASRGSEARRYLVADVVTPEGRPPAALLPEASTRDFAEGDDAVVRPGNTASGDLCLQAIEVWVFAERRGVVVAGTVQGWIAEKQKLVLRTRGGKELRCRCVAIEGTRVGPWHFTSAGEKGVSILLNFRTGLFWKKDLDYSRPESILAMIGKYPSLHFG